MDIQWMIQNAVQDKIVEQITAKTGLQWDVARKAISAAMPMIMGWLSKKANTDDWKNMINSAVDATSLEDIDESEGTSVLSNILWDDSTKVTQAVADQAWVTEQEANSITGMLTSWVLGKLSAEKQAGADVTADLEKDSAVQWLLTNFLDEDGDGDIKDDLMKKGMNMLKNKFFG